MVKTRILLAAGAALSAAALALTVPALAGAAAAPAAATAATHMVTATSLGGVVRPVSAAAAAARSGTGSASTGPASTGAPAASCREPDCNLGYHGGRVQHSPHVYLLFWGPKWKTAAAEKAAASYLQKFFKGLGKSPQDNWSVAIMQYADSKGHLAVGKAEYAGTHIDAGTPPKTVTLNDLGNEANKAFKFFGIKDPDDAQVVVAPQSGTCYKATSLGQFEGNCGKPLAASSATLNYCAYHTYNYDTATPNLFLPWITLPFQPDAKTDCGMGYINTPGTFDGFSVVAGHESAETATDPKESAWYDSNDLTSGGEVADKCSWGGSNWGDKDPKGDVKLATGTFAMQSLWSNAAGGCVMSGKLNITATPPAPQSSLLGSKVSLTVKTSGNGHAALTFTASGLPHGLSIGKHTGKITGTLGVTAGTYHPTVKVSYYAGSVSIKFKWSVSSKPGAIKGFAAKCVDDYLGHTTNGKIDLWSCDGKSQQQITFAANGELMLLGQCVTAYQNALLKPCSAAASQVWQRTSGGEYVVKSTGRCLTDPASRKANGTQLTLAVCKNSANQHWTLP
ncbi:MAG TPA: ricin-type beta-trefoil lectin domain protein [Trebonia sp.]|nr:ricin-type beta-trefoil lectin domain protein [Trebonia sp.]